MVGPKCRGFLAQENLLSPIRRTHHFTLEAIDTVCFTVGTISYLPWAKGLARSVLQNEPELPFFLLITDPKRPELELPFHHHWLEDWVDRRWLELARTFYSPFELCNAVKPIGHRISQDYYNASAWLYLDSDILITAPLSPLFQEYGAAEIILYPHGMKPNYSEAGWRSEVDWLKYGSFNGGALLLRRGKSSRAFIEWNELRLRYLCLDQINGLYTDQKWLDLVPSLFEDVAVSRIEQFNVAYWNIYERALTKTPDGRLMINGSPLIAFHFSQWNPDAPQYIKGSVVCGDAAAWSLLSSAYLSLLTCEGLIVQKKKKPFFTAGPASVYQRLNHRLKLEGNGVILDGPGVSRLRALGSICRSVFSAVKNGFWNTISVLFVR